uniref:Uncharacterized protein n=1 Tax=Glossina pallidipes TaxID=7398 RepID=A0A1B0A7Y1_GLOPL
MLSGDNNNNSKCGCLCSSSLTSSTRASKYVLCEDIQTPGLRRTDSSSSSSSSSSSNATINRVYNICSNNSNNNNNNNDNNSNNNNNNNNTNTNTDNHECCNQLISNRNRFISVSNNFNRLIKFIILLMLCSCCDNVVPYLDECSEASLRERQENPIRKLFAMD